MTQSTIARAACGAVLAIAIACGDSPTASAPMSAKTNAPSATNIAGFSLTPNLFDGESTMHRTVVLPDGRRFIVDAVRGADGLPHDMQISQDGAIVARLRNEWRVVGAKATLDRQQLVRYDNGSVVGAFDTRAEGGVEAIAGSAIAIPTAAVIDASDVSGVTKKVATFNRLGDDYASYGPCDGFARAVESALDGWIASCVGMAVGTATGNPLIAFGAYAVQLRAWRDVVRAEAALDDCVRNAGRPPEW